MRSEALPPVRSIAIFRALQLGDLLCAVPAWRALRAACPEARITLIGLPWARDFAQRYPGYIDDFLEFPGAPGLPERAHDAAAYPAFEARVRSRRFDLIVQMHGSGELTNPLVATWGATRIAGFHVGPDLLTAEKILLSWDEHEPEVRRHLRLVAALGADAQDEHLELPVQPWEQQAAAHELETLPRDYVCVHPGARYPSRRWPAPRFAAVADALAERGLRIVVTGSAGERELAREVIAAMRNPALDFTGRTTLGTFATLVSRARLVVCNDTGMSHVAVAVGTPSVVISSGADVRRWRPLDETLHPMLWHDVPCRPCGHVVCPTEHECAKGVAVESVLAEANRLLAREEARAA